MDPTLPPGDAPPEDIVMAPEDEGGGAEREAVDDGREGGGGDRGEGAVQMDVAGGAEEVQQSNAEVTIAHVRIIG